MSRFRHLMLFLLYFSRLSFLLHCRSIRNSHVLVCTPIVSFFRRLAKNTIALNIFFLLAACAGLGDDNTPNPAALTSYPFQFQPVPLWSIVTGGGMDKDFLRLGPVIKDGQVFVS